MIRDDLDEWLRLTAVPGIGAATVRKLLTAFGLPAQVLAQSDSAIKRVVGADAAARLRAGPEVHLVESVRRWIEAPQHSLVALGDEAYPAQLLEIPDPPNLLYVIGDLRWLNQPALAIVGSRNPTPQGLRNARDFARAISDAGLTVTSGLALGIDTSAHEGALEGRSSTIAVLGTGVDVIYPRRNSSLYERIAASGALVSEFPLGTQGVAANFPRRNRLISGLARGCLVVEAALQSGSLITAQLAVEQGREVFAIPGSIHSPLAKGCHALIKRGAKLVESTADLLEELRWSASHAPPATTTSVAAPASDAAQLLAHLGYDAIDLDTLCIRSGLTPNVVSAMLLELELAGHVAKLPGGRYERLAAG